MWDLPSLQVKQFLKKALTNGSSSSRRSSEVIYTICKGWSYSPPLDYKMYEMYERLTGANTIATNLTHRFSGKMKLSHHDGLSDSQHRQLTCVVSAQSGIQDRPFSPGLLFLLPTCCHRGASSNSLYTSYLYLSEQLSPFSLLIAGSYQKSSTCHALPLGYTSQSTLRI